MQTVGKRSPTKQGRVLTSMLYLAVYSQWASGPAVAAKPAFTCGPCHWGSKPVMKQIFRQAKAL